MTDWKCKKTNTKTVFAFQRIVQMNRLLTMHDATSNMHGVRRLNWEMKRGQFAGAKTVNICGQQRFREVM